VLAGLRINGFKTELAKKITVFAVGIASEKFLDEIRAMKCLDLECAA
jgi:hypothetical protein